MGRRIIELRNGQFDSTGLIIAAGLSARMGKFKPLLKFKGKSFLENIVIKLSEVTDRIVIVTGFKANEIENGLNCKMINAEINFIHNPEYERGMFSSLQRGIANSFTEWTIYHFIDQPNIPQEFYQKFIEQIDEKSDWIQPRYNNRNGHPILIKRSMSEIIINSKTDSNLRDVRERFNPSRKYWETNYPQILQDIDTKENYESMLKE